MWNGALCQKHEHSDKKEECSSGQVGTATLRDINSQDSAAHGHRLEALFVLGRATGVRREELLALKWRGINFATGTLQVRRILTHMPVKLNGKGGYVEAEPKTEKSRRSITLAPFALEQLKQHRVRQLEEKLKPGPAWTDHDLVFSRSGSALSIEVILKHIFYIYLFQKKKCQGIGCFHENCKFPKSSV